jgi:hypothetical protein
MTSIMIKQINKINRTENNCSPYLKFMNNLYLITFGSIYIYISIQGFKMLKNL